MTGAMMLAQETVSAGEAWTFWLLAPIAVIGAIGMVLARNAVHSAMWLVLTMLSLGVFFVVQQAPFLGLVQVIVYTGAIMMLFLFVLMLVGRDSGDSLIELIRGQRVAAGVLGLGLAALLAAGTYRWLEGTPSVGLAEANELHGGNVEGLANLLFSRWVLAFEATGALLIVAAVGALMLTHISRDPAEKQRQPERMRARFAPGNYPGPGPGPGVFATSSSNTTPAKLPDGTAAEGSVSPILPARELTAGEAANKETER
ncbi:NADH-quinone oxidoreductase subunit J [Natronosporangium hydrolyticum]|uniref:NADH-quinone oxidoreductase subunit J n=1 Tax=Natronosporangium hydrolyticum TaxID=2811111 RepID=A0A895YJQ2_9ACTN|nr:NADH-quinone oxidoreductase subunit J [Natronosporangium hydrolyticum]QSB14340.1 NADH-quinone oxidoreductase subunit J [Natronosporangium hydrolyticum]